mmetsp:Transcript_112037/g.311382  ORF Transcript_112037/g.311382 Transcript_112037/m.311382 type:complete len:165 (+) Transcript_112037:361-855(+)
MATELPKIKPVMIMMTTQEDAALAGNAAKAVLSVTNNSTASTTLGLLRVNNHKALAQHDHQFHWAKYLVFRQPMQLLTQGQWWSIRMTHRRHDLQWCARSGRSRSHSQHHVGVPGDQRPLRRPGSASLPEAGSRISTPLARRSADQDRHSGHAAVPGSVNTAIK